MKYRKKPVVIEAVQWTDTNLEEIKAFVGKDLEYNILDTAWEVGKGAPHVFMKIHTLEGDMDASVGDYIIKGVNGEFYPCKPDIFEKTYEVAKITTPKISIESDGNIVILKIDEKRVEGRSVDFHAKIGEKRAVDIKWSGIILKKDKKGEPIIKNNEVVVEGFSFDNTKQEETED